MVSETPLEFTEKGFSTAYTIADKMQELAEIAPYAAMSVWNIFGAAAFVIGVIKVFIEDNDVEEAIVDLQKQVDEIREIVTVIDARLDGQVFGQAYDINHARLNDLRDYFDEVQALQIRFKNGVDDPDEVVLVANEAGIVADKFLRRDLLRPGEDESDFDLFRWADVVNEWMRPPENRRLEPTVARHMFKNMPTLPIYVNALLTWYGARCRAIAMGQSHKLADDEKRVREHKAAVTVRGEFDKYATDRIRPATIAEHISSRIRSYPVSSPLQYAENGVCWFNFRVGSYMTGEARSTEAFSVAGYEDGALCTLDSAVIVSPPEEAVLEARSGLTALNEIALELARAEAFLGPSYPPFPDAVYFASDLYGVTNAMELVRSAQVFPFEDGIWDAPVRLATGMTYSVIVPGGAQSSLAKTVGLPGWFWFRQEGEGIVGPRAIGSWNHQFAELAKWRFFGTGYGVVYGIVTEDPTGMVGLPGDLYWARFDNYKTGEGTFRPIRRLSQGWPKRRHVFSSEPGVIYEVTEDGNLRWHRHTGWENGDNTWEVPRDIQGGFDWRSYQRIIPARDGMIFGVLADGRMQFHHHPGWKTGDTMVHGPAPIQGTWSNYWHLYINLAGAMSAVN